jgi:uncharacterized LabA/DUF88 family protein
MTDEGSRDAIERVGVYVDGHSMKWGASRLGLEVDYSQVLRVAREGGPRSSSGRRIPGLGHERGIVTARVYIEPLKKKVENSDHVDRFVEALGSLGYEVEECFEEGDSSKPAVDRDIIIDMLVAGLGGRVDTVMLLSCDGGYTRPVQILRAVGVRVIVYGFMYTPEALREAASCFVDLADPRAPGGPFTRVRISHSD